jgi:hypothetical protein
MAHGYDYIFKKYSHYKEIKYAKRRQELLNIYDAASVNPGLKSLSQLVFHFRFTVQHLKQIAKCILGIVGLKNDKAIS